MSAPASVCQHLPCHTFDSCVTERCTVGELFNFTHIANQAPRFEPGAPLPAGLPEWNFKRPFLSGRHLYNVSHSNGWMAADVALCSYLLQPVHHPVAHLPGVLQSAIERPRVDEEVEPLDQLTRQSQDSLSETPLFNHQDLCSALDVSRPLSVTHLCVQSWTTC